MFPWRQCLARTRCLGQTARLFSRFRSFEDAREFVKALHLRNQKEWQMFSKSGSRPRDIPSNPNVTYENSGWASFRDFLGNSTNSRFRSFEDAREFAQTLRLRNQKQWQAFSKSDARPKDIPSNPFLAYGGKGWVSLHDFLGVDAKPKKIGAKKEKKTKRKNHERGPIRASYEPNKSLATQARAVDVILSRCQKSSAIEMIHVGENGRASLIVRESTSRRWFGIRVRSCTFMSSRGCFEFNNYLNNNGLLVIFVSLFPIRCWIAHGSTLQASRTSIGTQDKWKQCEVSLKDLPNRVAAALKCDTLLELPHLDWYLPISWSHQVEYHLRNEIVEKLFNPLEWTIQNPRVSNSVVDFITDNGLRMQCKTARSRRRERGLLVDTYKFGGRIKGKNMKQPYSVHDEIDFFLVHIRFRNGQLQGVFVFSKKEATKHGWLRGDGHKGKVGTYVHPPFVSLPPFFEKKYQWQRDRYLDLSGEKVDIERARDLFRG